MLWFEVMLVLAIGYGAPSSRVWTPHQVRGDIGTGKREGGGAGGVYFRITS